MSDNYFDWFAYAEQAQVNFIERFVDLDASEHPDKVAEITEANRLQKKRGMYPDCTDALGDMMRQYVIDNPDAQYSLELLCDLFPITPILDSFGIKAEDVQRRIEQLQQGGDA